MTALAAVEAVSGAQGYAAQAEALVAQYESVRFAELHGWMLDMLPPAPGTALDVGAGSGRDAAGFAALGYRVLAVEPTGELRARARELHPSEKIEWLDDALPDLDRVMERGGAFDVVMVTAVWMHLDEAERLRAMPRVASLTRPGGVLAMALRHGPVRPDVRGERRRDDRARRIVGPDAGAQARRATEHARGRGRQLDAAGVPTGTVKHPDGAAIAGERIIGPSPCRPWKVRLPTPGAEPRRTAPVGPRSR